MLDEETIPTRETTSPVETILSPVGTILQILLRRVWTIVLVLVVVTGSTFAFSVRQMPTYEATVQMLVSQKNPGGPNLGGDIGGLQDATLTVAEMVPSMPIAQGVVEQLNLPDLSAEDVLRNMSVEPNPGTMVIDVSYTYTAANAQMAQERAQLIANAIGEVSTKKIGDAMVGANPIVFRVWNEATLPENPVRPNPVRNSIIALLLGCPLAVGIAFLLDYVDDSWKSPEEVKEFSGVPTFGVIPVFEVSAGKGLELLASKKEGE
jgi:capsular polysaccharide biosynthesis protein